MTSITAKLSHEQRRLLNLVHDTPVGFADARKMRTRAGIEHGEVIGLALADLIEAWRGTYRIDIPSSTHTLLYTGAHTLRLTMVGTMWVTENPLNKLLRTMLEQPKGAFDLRDASDCVEDDAVIIGAVGEGYATLHFKGDMKETKFDRAGGRYEFRHGADFVLCGTRKATAVLGRD